MQFEADIIKALQTMSNPFMDGLNMFLSFFGTETFFMIVAVIIYWCIDKKFGHRFLNVYVLAVAATSLMKSSFKRTRPFNAYRGEVRSIGDPEQSYSFPSGHTQTVSTISAMLVIKYGKKYRVVTIACAALTVLVMLSRMYLGQHYLSDVFTGLAAGVFFSIAFNALFSLFKDKEEWFFSPAVIAEIVIVAIFGSGGGAEHEFLLKGAGAFAAFDIGYFFEKHLVRYDVKANRKIWAYALRLILGLGVMVAIQQLFKLFLPESMPMLRHFLRYFLMALWAAIGAPMVFKVLKI